MIETVHHSAPVADALSDQDEVQVARTHAAARCLAARGMEVSCAVARATEADWYLGPSFAFRPAIRSRAPRGATPETLALVLDSQRNLLDEMETALGLAAEFEDFGALPQDSAVVQFARQGDALGEIAVWQHPPLAPSARAGEPLRMACIAARIPLHEAENLDAGDMVVLLSGPWKVDPAGAPGLPPTLAFDPTTGRLGASLRPNQSMTEPLTMNDPHAAPMTVPVSLYLTDTVLSPEELDDMATGGTIMLGPIEEGLTVNLLVGGRSIGSGELIKLGSRFAVLLSGPAVSQSPDSGRPDTTEKPDDDDMSEEVPQP